jgi:hypothetical protein
VRTADTGAPERAGLLKRVFEVDMQHGPNCGRERKIIAAVLEAEPGRQRP